MDQVIINDNHYMTREFLETQLTENKARIANLEEATQNSIRRTHTEMAERQRVVTEMQEWTLNELENNGITESQAEDISSIVGFELTKEFELEVTVMYSITVNAKNEEEAQNLIHDIDFDSVSEPQGVTYLSSSVDRIDI